MTERVSDDELAQVIVFCEQQGLLIAATIFRALADKRAYLMQRIAVEATEQPFKNRTLVSRLDDARTALADIAMSSDMTLEVARAKALRVYWRTADRPGAAHEG